MRQKCLCVNGEYAQRIYAYMLRRCKETLGVLGEYAKRHKSVYISVNNNIKFEQNLYSFHLHYMGWIKPKNYATVPLKVVGNEKYGGSR